ncbi:sulfotransferase family protein [Pseudoalteromonas sp. DY56-GL22]|uniref:sulfotransferase n=1 Tax=Pseudoalteromonas sp. DY56-GL22 TaxID=2967126 RepID=UPI00352A2A1E
MSSKIFIIGLPRTGTTSICNSFLQLGYKTAHTAYTQQAITSADVIADTPVFSEYALLDEHFANSRFINLERDLTKWLPSIRQLLARMHTNLMRPDGGFNSHLKRCYFDVFGQYSLAELESDEYLTACYQRHQQQVADYFKGREQQLLTLDVADSNSPQLLQQFLNTQQPISFKQLNMGGKVTAWNDIKHPDQVSSTRSGKIDKSLGYNHT